MAHEDKQNHQIKQRDLDNTKPKENSMQQQLIDANKEINDLKLELEWLNRPYE
jgi:hypothetical protein